MNTVLSEHYIDCIVALNRREKMDQRPMSLRVRVAICDVDFEVHELAGLQFRADLTAECTVWRDGSVDDTRAFDMVEIDDPTGGSESTVPPLARDLICAAYREAILRALTRAAGGYEAVHELARQERDRKWHAMKEEAALEKRREQPV